MPNLDAARRSYADSCAELQRLGLLEPGAIPPIPDHLPQADDDDPSGVSFFRTQVDGDLSNLTLPRTFFGRSLVRDASFQNTDLSESNLCWCDFVQVDFSRACLRSSDLRGSIFDGVRFVNCDLRNADLRHATFRKCDFAGADLAGAKLGRRLAWSLVLDAHQQASIDWQTFEGETPPGG
ncbi:MAG: pentapeptide repeat-containing protein [Phycisphaerae bacterium]|nr:pentapeptide repeat-containing protein [Phycisphaerae bacterium]